jgi:S-DNA-T family DNA segregation ATPase FtsK/SpoIIIE
MLIELTAASVRIGRQDCEVLLDQDNQVSRFHARIERTADGMATIHDNSSTNGTWVNGQRITEMLLAPGDELRAGASILLAEG